MVNPLRRLTIPAWLILHYVFAGFIMWYAEPTPTIARIEGITGNAAPRYIAGGIFLLTACLMLFNRCITQRCLLRYLSVWVIYVLLTVITALNSIVTGAAVPGIYIALLAYIGEIVFLLMAYSVYGQVSEVAEYIADREPLWRKLLSWTDLAGYDREK